MFLTSRTRRAAGSLALSGALVAGLAAAAQPASAAAVAPSACQASAVNLALLGSASAAANTANPANSPCISDYNGNNVSGLGTIAATAITSSTTANQGVGASAEAKVVGLHADASNIANGLVTPLTTGTTSILPSVSSAVTGQLGAGGSITAALAPLKALGLNVGSVNNVTLGTETKNSLPTALSATLPDLVDADLIDAQATATCSSSVATLSGRVTLTGTTVLGQTIDVNDTVGKVLSVDTSSLTLSQLVSVSDILKSITVQPTILSDVANALGSTAPTNLYDALTNPLLGGVNPKLTQQSHTTVSAVLSAVDAAVAPVLASTSIPLPNDLLQATISPQVVSIVNGVQTSTALSVNFTALGQTLLTGYLAQASVSDGGAGCDHPVPVPTTTPKPTPTPHPEDGFNANAVLQWKAGPAAAVLQCGGGLLRLIDVRQQGSKTLVKGVADSSLVGQTATIYATYGNKKVGKAKVDSDGVFEASVPLPAKSIRTTNAARFYALIGTRRTAALKFNRRMYTSSLSRAGSKVSFKGYVTAPLAKKGETVVIQRRVSCDKFRNVGTAKVNGSGKFVASFGDPAGATAAIYRAQSSVPKYAHSKKTFATYTLPQPLAS